MLVTGTFSRFSASLIGEGIVCCQHKPSCAGSHAQALWQAKSVALSMLRETHPKGKTTSKPEQATCRSIPLQTVRFLCHQPAAQYAAAHEEALLGGSAKITAPCANAEFQRSVPQPHSAWMQRAQPELSRSSSDAVSRSCVPAYPAVFISRRCFKQVRS